MIIRRFFEEVFFDEIYKPVRELGNKRTAIDLGATAGEFSLWAYPQFEFIYAIEPVKKQFNFLKENVADFPKITVFNLALGDNNRGGHMTNGAWGGSSLSLDETPTDNEIEVQTLMTFIDKNNLETVDCLKIDIEDGEKAVFEAEDFPRVAEKVRYIIGEHVGHLSKGVLENLGFKMEEYKFGYIFKR